MAEVARVSSNTDQLRVIAIIKMNKLPVVLKITYSPGVQPNPSLQSFFLQQTDTL